ncbi:hypothetical protein ACFY00_33050 [Kitasatospora sp. NPDC001540]|uniref:hypothetical protein n=1 Tax=Kitasatospora sp. NPDC001540 TaxID=3364014 RepID=UPI0036800053
MSTEDHIDSIVDDTAKAVDEHGTRAVQVSDGHDGDPLGQVVGDIDSGLVTAASVAFAAASMAVKAKIDASAEIRTAEIEIDPGLVTAASAAFAAASMAVKAKIDASAEIRKAEIEAETRRLEIVEETKRERLRLKAGQQAAEAAEEG